MKPEQRLDSLLTSVREVLYEQQRQQQQGAAKHPPPMPLPFVTVSRQAGAGGHTFAKELAKRQNETDSGGWPWTVWDRELVEKVARENRIPESLVESLEHPRGWLQEFFAAFSPREGPELDEHQVYRRVAATIRGIARAGRAVIVGRGGVYATSNLPGGVHVRLVAPLEYRVNHIADLLNVPQDKAAAEVRRRDADREAFHHRYWPGKALLPEIFTITLNTARVGEARMAECVLPLIPRRQIGSQVMPTTGAVPPQTTPTTAASSA